MRFLFLIIFFCTHLFSQLEWYNHSELDWKTIETEHFIICFHDETERSARETAVIAEKIYPHLTDLYDYKPSNKTAIIISDYNKGFLIEDDIAAFAERAECPVFLDTKKFWYYELKGVWHAIKKSDYGTGEKGAGPGFKY